MPRKSGWFIPITTLGGEIRGLMYHCEACMQTYQYIKQIDRCISCGLKIDFDDLRELKRKYPWI